jgi:hypothetical protein
MDKEEKYRKVIDTLKKSRPDFKGKEHLTDRIMREIGAPKSQSAPRERLFYSFFGWVDHSWLRLTMATAAFLLAGVFIIQQVVMADRINQLENHMIRAGYAAPEYDLDQGINHSVLLDLVVRDQVYKDSITVSRSDLIRLLKNYQELLQNYHEINPDFNMDREIQKIINKEFDQKDVSN